MFGTDRKARRWKRDGMGRNLRERCDASQTDRWDNGKKCTIPFWSAKLFLLEKNWSEKVLFSKRITILSMRHICAETICKTKRNQVIFFGFYFISINIDGFMLILLKETSLEWYGHHKVPTSTLLRLCGFLLIQDWKKTERTSAEVTWENFQKARNSIPCEVLRKYIFSMKNRCLVVIRARGGHTKY